VDSDETGGSGIDTLNPCGLEVQERSSGGLDGVLENKALDGVLEVKKVLDDHAIGEGWQDSISMSPLWDSEEDEENIHSPSCRSQTVVNVGFLLVFMSITLMEAYFHTVQHLCTCRRKL
jgi:hypothetical protein